MDPEERNKISDALIYLKMRRGDFVVKQGEEGNMFFMIEEGELVALKVN